MAYTDVHGRRKRAEKRCSTKTKATAVLREMRRQADGSGVVTESSVTVAAYIERWISATLAASDRRPSTREGYRILLRRHVVPHIGGRRLRDLTPGDVEALTLLLSESLAPSTVRQTYIALRLVLDTAERDGLVRRNVAALVDRPRVPKREAVAFTPA